MGSPFQPEEAQDVLGSYADASWRFRHQPSPFLDFEWDLFLAQQPIEVAMFYQRYMNSGLKQEPLFVSTPLTSRIGMTTTGGRMSTLSQLWLVRKV